MKHNDRAAELKRKIDESRLNEDQLNYILGAVRMMRRGIRYDIKDTTFRG